MFAFWCLSRDAVRIELTGLKRCLFISGSPTPTASKNEQFFFIFPSRSSTTELKKGESGVKGPFFSQVAKSQTSSKERAGNKLGISASVFWGLARQ